MSSLIKVAKNIGILVVATTAGVYLSFYFGQLYNTVFDAGSNKLFSKSATAIDSLIGLPLSYTFFTTLLFTAFGDKNKYIWLSVLLFPAALFEVMFDLRHLYFPIIIGLAGWGLGQGIKFVITKFVKD